MEEVKRDIPFREAMMPKEVHERELLEEVFDELDCVDCGAFLKFHPGTIQECPDCHRPYIFCNHVCKYKFLVYSLQNSTYLFMCGICLRAQVRHRDFFEFWLLVA